MSNEETPDLTDAEIRERTTHLAMQDLKILELVEKTVERYDRLDVALKAQLYLLQLMNTRVTRLERAMEPISVEAVLDGAERPQTGMTAQEIQQLEVIKEILGGGHTPEVALTMLGQLDG